MVKNYNRTTPLGGRGQHFRIGFSDLEPIWNSEDEKYKVFCRSVHVSKATLYIGYVQLFVSFLFSIFFAYHYVLTIGAQRNDVLLTDQQHTRYLSQLMLAVSIQVILVILMIHGVKVERKSFLMPYIIYSAIAVLTGTIGLINDLIYLDRSVVYHGDTASRAAKNQFISHLFGTVIQAWCLSIVWKTYGFLGEKKVARQIREQLNNTASAFHYPENLITGYSMVAQPPPYVDTVMSPSTIPPIVINSTEKQAIQPHEMAPAHEIRKPEPNENQP